MLKKYLKKLFWLSTLGLFLMLVVIFSANQFIERAVANKTYDKTQFIDHHKVGLVLGTAKRLKNGNLNLYFKYRIEAVVELYKSGKIDFVLVSGDNGNKEYDEPSDFKEELIKKGIPENKIYLDYAGFRTLDSVVRSKEIFGQTSIVFISQKFHNERAIYLAENFGINAVGYNAKDVSSRYGFRVQAREYLARTKVFVDMIFGVEPKFLGQKIEIK